MTTFFRIFLLVFLAASTLNATPDRKLVNLVVVLDLSDRLLIPGQAAKDKATILAAFAAFEDVVRSQLFVKSKDVFSVVILPQRNSVLRADAHETRLRLDMGRLAVTEKNRKYMEFKANLGKLVDNLYAEAGKGTKTSDYFGVDIWQFFNQSINDYLLPGATNQVVMLTDGYLDFESDTHTARVKNRYTSSKFLRSLSGADWKQVAEAKDLGIYPIQNKIVACKLIVTGLNAKYGGQSELDKLRYFWTKWLSESELANFQLISNTNSAQMGSTVSNALK